jgi:glycosyltransferase involved in cell wall biosynthesis
MDKVTIIIPVRNSMPWLELTIDSIKDNTKFKNFKIIFMESESTDGTAEYTEYLAKVYPKVVRTFHEKKEGVTKMLIKAISLADPDSDIFLTQDDVIFPKLIGSHCWLTRLNIVANKFSDVGIVTSLNGGGKSGPNYCDGFDWVGTWCMYICRRVLDQGITFDERFNPGDGDDIDFTYAVKKAGFKVSYTEFAVDHHRKFTVEGHEYEDQNIRDRNSKRFKEKWGVE